MSTGIVLGHLTFALILFLLLPTRRLSPGSRLGVLAGAALLGTVPFEGVSLATFMRSVTDDLAMTTLLWLAWCAASRVRGVSALPERQRFPLILFFALLALLLYPAALGLSLFDPYRLGYSPRLLLAVISLICLGFWLRRLYFGAALLTVATTLFIIDIKRSDNYWDYLVDPLLGLFCCFYLLWYVGRRVGRNFSLQYDLTLPAGMTAALSGNQGSRSMRCKHSPAATFSAIAVRAAKKRAVCKSAG